MHVQENFFSIIDCENSTEENGMLFANWAIPNLIIKNKHFYFGLSSNLVPLGGEERGICIDENCSILFWEDDEAQPLRWGIGISVGHAEALVEMYVYPKEVKNPYK